METIIVRWITKGGRRWKAPIRVSGGHSTVQVKGRKSKSASDEPPIELVGEKPLPVELQFNGQEQPIELVGEKRKLLGSDEDEELR